MNAAQLYTHADECPSHQVAAAAGTPAIRRAGLGPYLTPHRGSQKRGGEGGEEKKKEKGRSGKRRELRPGVLDEQHPVGQEDDTLGRGAYGWFEASGSGYCRCGGDLSLPTLSRY